MILENVKWNVLLYLYYMWMCKIKKMFGNFWLWYCYLVFSMLKCKLISNDLNNDNIGIGICNKRLWSLIKEMKLLILWKYICV